MPFALRTTLALTLGVVLLSLGPRPPVAHARLPDDPTACLTLARDTVDLEGPVRTWRNTTFDEAKQTGDFQPLLEPDSIRISVGKGTGDGGLWTSTPSGGRVWCLEIKTPTTGQGESRSGTLQLVFGTLSLPNDPDAELIVYDDNEEVVLGPYDAGDNAQEGFITEEVCFEDCSAQRKSLIVAFYEPPGTSSTFSVAEAIHGFNNPTGFGESLSCNINASLAPDCSTSRPWTRGIRATVQVIEVNFAGGRRFKGNGVLLNNTAQDLTPYVLSASHLIAEGIGDHLNDVGNLNFFRINYQSDRCGTGTPSEEPSYHVVTGGKVVAKYSIGDFVLIRLPRAIPQSYEVHYAGWSIYGGTPEEGIVIGHPQGDVKKISFDHDPVIENSDEDEWEVAIDEGAIESGHSGAPLFDEEHRVVGYMSHGWANACAPPPPGRDTDFPKLAAYWEDGLESELDSLETSLGTIQSVAGYDLEVADATFADPATDWAAGFFRTAGSIDAENVTVQSSSRLILRAREHVRIEGPFLAQAGSDFEARIDDRPTLTELGIPETYQPPSSIPTVAGREEAQLQAQQSTQTAGTSEEASSSAALNESNVPTHVMLSSNYPNPFHQQTVIRYGLPEETHVRLVVYDLLGREIAVLVDGRQHAGFHRLTWDAAARPSGMYFYHLQAGDEVVAKSMTLVR